MIVVFGSEGQVGQALQQVIGEAPEHVFLSRDSRDYCGDITNTAGITETLMDLKPEIIINAAAYTDVDQAEREPEIAMAVNASAPGMMAQIAAKQGALLLHYSSDYVFDGAGTRPWKETDPCAPLSVYGQSKRKGEEAIIGSGAKHFILRSSWVYHPNATNFLTTMLRMADTQQELRVIHDQWGAPTSANYLAEVSVDLINLATPGYGGPSIRPDWGIYHCAPMGATTWFEYARLVINTAKSRGFAKNCKAVVPVTTKDYGSVASRPLNARLDTSKLQSVLGTVPPDWQEGVIDAVLEALSERS